ncbi:hypothetical protein TTHERM_000585027 (macronuclear) [Tetrahymena thermophila SB210]|uniref:Uncharacterized protein n=1 Tax=Tetrahymena thermophila (strain SB210) TaxID=312017 RepID=W7X7K6_TETTS|nr:hypothetical protein TTHERM_000585027 [Tetrahymena thermophila SB210]EWS72373.1 hypothetical protein TTHERM_000585027 [Tetrahymena thermophila SB210]|eukprot:XP_012655095.1 hypothetical protein TTHERM_000585027 [Tetrahymena thermophila SB210]
MIQLRQTQERNVIQLVINIIQMNGLIKTNIVLTNKNQKNNVMINLQILSLVFSTKLLINSESNSIMRKLYQTQMVKQLSRIMNSLRTFRVKLQIIRNNLLLNKKKNLTQTIM